MEVTTVEVTAITGLSAESGGSITGDPADVSSYLPLVDLLMKNKFQLYNKSRQKITADVYSTTPLRPFQLFEDSQQSESGDLKKFVLVGYRYNLTRDMYSVELLEYDNTTEVNLINS